MAVVIATQTGLVGGRDGTPVAESAAEGPEATPVAAQQPAPETEPEPEPEIAAGEDPAAPAVGADRSAELQGEIDRLTGELDAGQAAYDAIAEQLAARDGEIAELTEALAMRDAELEELRIELAELRDRLAFDIQLAAMKLDTGAGSSLGRSGAESEVATDAADAALDAAKASPDASDVEPGAVPDGTVVPVVAFGALERALTNIHFEFGSASLTPGGQTHAAVAAAMLAEMDLSSIRLVGFTDRVGNPAKNAALAERRARAVAEFLVANGLPEDLIETEGMGEQGAPIVTDDNVREPLNRCVTIFAVPQTTT